MTFLAKMATLVERASVVAVQSSMLPCDEFSTIIFIHCVRADGAIRFILGVDVYQGSPVSVGSAVHARIDTHFYYIAALDGSFVIHVLVGQPCGALLALLVPLRLLEVAAFGLHNKFGGWIQNAHALDHNR